MVLAKGGTLGYEKLERLCLLSMNKGQKLVPQITHESQSHFYIVFVFSTLNSGKTKNLIVKD